MKKKSELVTCDSEENNTEVMAASALDNHGEKAKEPQERLDSIERLFVDENNTEVMTAASDNININFERRKLLKDQVQTMELLSEATAGTEIPNHQHGSARKTWKERLAERTNDWKSSVEEFYKALIISNAYVQNICSHCNVNLKFYTKCNTCCEIYCYECDQKLHSTTPFHQRSLFSENHSQILLPTDFVNCSGKVFHQGIHYIHALHVMDLTIFPCGI